MVKPLSFKGDKKSKKWKRIEAENSHGEAGPSDLAVAKIAKTQEEGADDDSWVAAEAIGDLIGPVMFVLPTEPATCLACDANGKVFTDPIVNVIDANPTTAEPHDVRQVWVANKISGSDNFRFKGRYGKYLGCDKYGILSASSEAVSPLETWNVIPTADTPGTFQLQTQRDTYVTVKEATKANAAPEARGDATDIAFSTTLRIRMQARFKPKLKASKEEKAKEKISRKELEEAVGRRLNEDEVRTLKRARREGDYHEQLLVLKVKNKHDKYG